MTRSVSEEASEWEVVALTDSSSPPAPLNPSTRRTNTNDIDNGIDNDMAMNTNDASSSPSLNQRTKKRKGKRRRLLKPWQTKLYYWILATVAVGLTISAKGTQLWSSSSTSTNPNSGDDNKGDDASPLDRGTLNHSILYSLLGHYALVLLTYLWVQGSNPGYITLEVMQGVSSQDGWTVTGEERTPDMMEQGRGGGGRLNHALESDSQDTETKTALQLPPTSSASSPSVPLAHRTKERTVTGTDQDGSSIELSNLPSTQIPLQNTKKHDDLDSCTDDPITNQAVPPPPHHHHEHPRTRRNKCPNCNFAPPVRSHYCKDCRQCVATFDHYCHFIGTCIGERNHGRFYIFLVAQWLGFKSCVDIVSSSNLGVWSLFISSPGGKDHVASNYWDTILVICAKVYLYPLIVMAFLMMVVHTWLALTNSTTFELEKGQHLEYLQGFGPCDLPFSNRGLCGVYHNVKLFVSRDAGFQALVCRTNQQEAEGGGSAWRPILWHAPEKGTLYSTDWRNNLWQNQYWSCC